ncbi:MAG: hypothetical protein Q8N76_04095 [Candidatus Omnitrophota bacterium]|nr:hypothetical protein [Candidatus Omnitrophota bacterium]
MKKITAIIITFIFIFSGIGYSSQDTHCLRTVSLFQKKPGESVADIVSLMNQRKWAPQFSFAVRLPDNTVLNEPSGFPGKWIVALGDGVEKDDKSMAQAMRLAKSFSVSCMNVERGDVKKAHFIIIKALPEGGENIYSCKDFIIQRDLKYGFKIFVRADFLNISISEQRRIFSVAIKELPKNIEYNYNGKIATPGKELKIIIYDNPFNRRKPSSQTAFALKSMLKGEKDMQIYSSFGPGGADAVIFSAVQNDIPKLGELVEDIRKRYPNIAILCGGHAPTIIPEHTAAYASELNVIYRGDADGSLAGLIRASVAAQANPGFMTEMFEDLPGGIYAAGNIFYFYECGSINSVTKEGLENREFDFSMLKNSKEPFEFMSGIGCSHGPCIFCAIGARRQYIGMSPEKVVRIAEQYGKRSAELGSNVPVVHFNDDNVLADKPRLLKILKLLKESKSGVKVDKLMGRLENLLIGDKPGQRKVDTEFLDSIADAEDVFSHGPQLDFGTEHLVVPNEFGKGNYTYEEIRSVMEECGKRKIKNIHYQILTHPDMTTQALLLQTIRMAYCLVKYGSYTYFPYGNMHYAVTPYLCTSAYNKVLRNGNTDLIIDDVKLKPAKLEQVQGFPEYDYYASLRSDDDVSLLSRLIPKKINLNYLSWKRLLFTTLLKDNQQNRIDIMLKLFNGTLGLIFYLLDSDDREKVLYALDEKVIEEWQELKSLIGNESPNFSWVIKEIDAQIAKITNKIKEAQHINPVPARNTRDSI